MKAGGFGESARLSGKVSGTKNEEKSKRIQRVNERAWTS